MKKKRVIILLILIITIFTTAGCEKVTFKSETKSKFNIVFPEKEIRKYIKKAKKNVEDIDRLYKEIVYEPIRSEFTKDTPYPDYDFPEFQHPIMNLDGLEKELETLIEEDIISMVEEGLNKCDSILFSEGTTVYIVPIDPNDTYSLKGGGVEGATSFNRKMILFINPMAEGWKKLFSHTLTHEYHHIVRLDRIFQEKQTMLEYLVLEGQANSFANIIYPDVEKMTISPLPIMKEKDMWDKIKENIDSLDYKYQYEIMFGGCKGIPRLCGYRMGYSIMQEFIKNNPDITIEEWTEMDAKEILEKSGYEESLEERWEEYHN